MKLFLQTTLILVIFFKTGNLLSDNNLFNVNNILLERKNNTSSNQLANQAIKKAFNQLISRVLLQKDTSKVSSLGLIEIKELVSYYNISKNKEENNEKINFSVTFDKEKMHDLFYKKEISYSDIIDKEFYILPILINDNNIFVFSNNYFYENWSNEVKSEIIEFILPLENIEMIQIINQYRDNLLNLELDLLLKEYQNKNISVVLIDQTKAEIKKIFIKARIQKKIFSKNLILKTNNINDIESKKQIFIAVKDEITNLVKSQNLIDIRTPSFLNVKLNLDKKSNLVVLRSKIKNIDLIENIYVQEFNKDYVNLKMKYLGKLEKIITQLKNQDISLQLINDQWFIKTF